MKVKKESKNIMKREMKLRIINEVNLQTVVAKVTIPKHFEASQ